MFAPAVRFLVIELHRCSALMEKRSASTRAGLPRAFVYARDSDVFYKYFNVLRLPAFRAFDNGEFHCLPFGQSCDIR
jgi:hypothetical protein